MNIAIITSRYPSKDMPYNHMFVHMRAFFMMNSGYKVKVYVPSKDQELYEYQSVIVEKLPSSKIIDKLSNYDVYYLHLLNIYPLKPKEDGWGIYKYILRNNRSFAMYVHGSEVQRYGSRMFEFNYKLTDFLKWIKKDLFVIPRIRQFVNQTKSKRNSMYVFPSDWMRINMEENLGEKISNYKIIPNGINTELFKFSSLEKNKHKLVTLRPLSSKKYAVDIAIKVMKHLPKHFTLEIYGKGIYKEEYQKLIEDYKLINRVTIIEKFIHRKDLNSFFSNFGVLLSPTRMDAQGVTMCEGMASGLLVASSNNTAIPEFVQDYSNGVLSNNPKDLALKIKKVVDDDNSLYSKITLNGRKSMEAIAVDKTVPREIEVLKTVIGNGEN